MLFAIEHRRFMPSAHQPELEALSRRLCIELAIHRRPETRLTGRRWSVCEAASTDSIVLLMKHSVLIKRIFILTTPDISSIENMTLLAERSLSDCRLAYSRRIRQEFADLLGPAAMDPILSSIQMNLAIICPSDRVLDPFGGAGSIMEALPPEAAIESCCVADCWPEYLKRYRERLRHYRDMDQARNYTHGIAETAICLVQQWKCWRQNSFDVIVTDPPYDQRIRSVSSSAHNEGLLTHLFDLARHCTPGNRLCFWWPKDRSFSIPADFNLTFKCIDKQNKRTCWTFGSPPAILVKPIGAERILSSSTLHEAVVRPRPVPPNHGPGSVFEMARRGTLQHQSLTDLPNLSTLGAMKDPDGKGLLFYAAGYGQLETVCWLIERGVCKDPLTGGNARFEASSTPLSYAARFGHCGIVQILVDRALVCSDIESDKRLSVAVSEALYQAARFGHSSVVRLLLIQRYASLINVGESGRAFIATCRYGHREVCQLLLLQAKHREQFTVDKALAEAARWGHRDIVQLLLMDASVSLAAISAARLAAEKFCRIAVLDLLKHKTS